MKFYAEIFGLTGLLPLLVSVVLASLFSAVSSRNHRNSPDGQSADPTVSPIALVSRYAGAFSFAVAFFVSWFSLPWIPWQAKLSWQWFPWLILFNAIVLGAVQCGGPDGLERNSIRVFRRLEWFAIIVGLSSVNAFAIVPDWTDMQPPAWVAVTVIATISVVVVIACQHLTYRLPANLLAACLILNGLFTAVLMGFSGSVKFAQIAGAMTAASVGCLWVSHRRRLSPNAPHVENNHTAKGLAIRTLMPTFLIANVGLIYTGFNNSFAGIPDIAFILTAMAPVTLNVSCVPAIGRVSDRMRTIIAVGIIAIPLVTASVIAGIKTL